jgi:hypothetical protein
VKYEPTKGPSVVALVPPVKVGPYSRVETKRFDDPEQGVGYQYSDGTPDWLTVFLYPRPAADRLAPVDLALDHEMRAFKQGLELERQSGTLSDFKIAFVDPDSLAVAGKIVYGRLLLFALSRGRRQYVSFFYLYPCRDGFIKVRGTIPVASWETAPIPQFSHEVVFRLLQTPQE